MQTANIKTTSDLMSVALQAEREAIRRYSQLADSMHKGNNETTAALFTSMALEEQEHERILLEWMAQEGIKENPEISAIDWHDPQVATTYNEEARDPIYSSPYKALAFAVHNEEIAFRFYTHIAAESDDKTVRHYAEILAREELRHAALLRAERRLAYHAERESSSTEPRLNPKAIHNEADLLKAAIHIDNYLAKEISLISSTYPELKTLSNQIQQQIINNELALKNNISPGEDILKNLEQLKLYNSYMNNQFNKTESEIQRLWACCDRSFAFYDDIVKMATDENVMLTAQKLSSSALDRINIIKHIINDS